MARRIALPRVGLGKRSLRHLRKNFMGLRLQALLLHDAPTSRCCGCQMNLASLADPHLPPRKQKLGSISELSQCPTAISLDLACQAMATSQPGSDIAQYFGLVLVQLHRPAGCSGLLTQRHREAHRSPLKPHAPQNCRNGILHTSLTLTPSWTSRAVSSQEVGKWPGVCTIGGACPM